MNIVTKIWEMNKNRVGDERSVLERDAYRVHVLYVELHGVRPGERETLMAHPRVCTFSLRGSPTVLAELVKPVFAFSPHSFGPDGGWEWHASSPPSAEPLPGNLADGGGGEKRQAPCFWAQLSPS